MLDLRGVLSSQRSRAIFGAGVLHIGLLAGVLTWQPVVPAPRQETIPVVLIEVPAIEPETVADPEPDPELAPVRAAEPEVRNIAPDPVEPAPAQRQQARPEPEARDEKAPAQDTFQPAPSLPPPVSPGVAVAQVPEEEDPEPGIDPRYVYKFDPFAERAPSALARVSRAVNCLRANLETRPSFCPDYDEDQLFLASIAANRQSNWGQLAYDPVRDIAAARGALGQFTANQDKARSTGSSEVARATFDKVVIPDEDCQPVPFGFGSNGGADSNIALPDSKTVYCR